MNKIGILTWYFGANYGAIAQSIALSRTVNSLGYDCFMVNYKPENYKKVIMMANLPKKNVMLFHPAETIKGIKKCIVLSKREYFKESRRVYTAKDIDNLEYDCIILGSDAIFNTDHLLCTPIYYGVDIKTKKVLYSPSCEYLDVDTELPVDYIKSLQEMSALSVRDENTGILIKKNTGLNSPITLDPTFLYDFCEFKDTEKMDRYILIYSFSDWTIYKDAIVEFSKKNNLPIVSIGRNLKWADYSYATASFETWVSSFRKADLVITDSFHGMVFSIKNRKQIVLCGRKDKESKIISLLKQVRISLTTYQGETLEDYLKANYVDYNLIVPIIEREKEKSLDYLNNALNS